jgi:transposase
MQGFVQGADRQQTTLLPECLDDRVDEGNSIRAVDVFVDALELRDLGFDGVDPAATGRPAYHASAPCISAAWQRQCANCSGTINRASRTSKPAR